MKIRTLWQRSVLAAMLAAAALVACSAATVLAADEPAAPAQPAKVVAADKAPAAATAEKVAATAGQSPYAKGGNPLFDPNFVPIAVNCQNVANAAIYAAAGINVFDMIDDITETPDPAMPWQSKPSAEVLKKLSDLGIYLIAEQTMWKGQMANPTIIAWESPVDEPDNIQDKTGKAMPLDEYLAQSKAFKANDPSRPYIVCFGQGLINDRFKGRGIERSEYPKYMGIVDYIHYDVYPITNCKLDDGEKHLDLVGLGISRIREWTGDKKPTMCWIETNHIANKEKAPTPAQTNCEVWINFMHGAKGVGYFCHDFTLEAKKASALSRDLPMLAQLKVTNAKLKKLAQVINSPMAVEPAEQKSAGGKVVASVKKVGADFVIIAVNEFGDPAKATLRFEWLKKGAKVEALEEGGRTIEIGADGLADDFGPYQEHVYKVSGK